MYVVAIGPSYREIVYIYTKRDHSIAQNYSLYKFF